MLLKQILNNTDQVKEDSVGPFQISQEIHTVSQHRTNHAYVAGWIVKKILSLKQFKNCVACKRSLLTIDTTREEYMQLIHREYVREKSSLTYPSMSFLKQVFLEADSILNENISSVCFWRNISVLLHERLNQKLNSDFIQCFIRTEELKFNIIRKITKTVFIYIL